ncbi:hypothetical protein HPP92_023808 [Vanilla planifolia]|uniref:WD repeat-containing protein 76 n=1 Tax=Vanilla planifolia TaxID=51239 RepID=A0A835PLQ4_VANPL|nr:hypothetical protein HPP92_023808 [Vanilla planifolia]
MQLPKRAFFLHIFAPSSSHFAHARASSVTEMAPKKTLTDYERRRLENIRRNDEMIAALNLHSKASALSASLKRGYSKAFSSPTASKKLKHSPPRSPVVIRRSLRTRGLPPTAASGNPHDSSQVQPFQSPNLPPACKLEQMGTRDAFVLEGPATDRPLLNAILESAAAGGGMEVRSDHFGDCRFDPRSSMELKPENVARVVSERILCVQFLPCSNRTVVVVGNKIGNLGFWDVDFGEGEEHGDGNGIYIYAAHSAPISGISVHPFSMTKIFTASYDGFLRMMDVNKETFNATYSTENCIFSIHQRSCDINALYVGEGGGMVKLWDERSGKISGSWNLHKDRINTVDFNPENLNLMATSSTDGTACIWDLRSIKKYQSKQLKMVQHKRAVHSAYFSPSGVYLATTSFDDRIGILSVSDPTDLSMVRHNNQTGRWLSSFRAIWGWDDSFLFLGNMERTVDIISTSNRTITALESPEITSIPCRFAAHPFQIGTLACSTAGGKVFLWTKS